MKNKFAMTIGGMIAAAILGLGFSQSGTVQADPNLSQEDIRPQLQKQYPGKITELELDNEAKNPIYEVEINIEGKEYELSVDGNNGEVLKLSEKPIIEPTIEEKDNNDDGKEDDSTKNEKVFEKNPQQAVEKTGKDENASDNKDNIKVTEEVNSNTQTAKAETEVITAESPKENDDDNKAAAKSEKKTKKAVIGESKAKSIALGQFSGNVEEIELDNDDGRFIYEVEIENGNKEADIEINAYTGEVLVIEIDTEDDDDR